jgi:hypothetical protein
VNRRRKVSRSMLVWRVWGRSSPSYHLGRSTCVLSRLQAYSTAARLSRGECDHVHDYLCDASRVPSPRDTKYCPVCAESESHSEQAPQQVTDESDKQPVIERLKAEVVFLRQQIRSSEEGSSTPQDLGDRPNEREIKLQNQVLDVQESYTALSQY